MPFAWPIQLPAEIGRLKELRHFNMSNNKIAVIPASIANLTRLRVCDLSDNRISALPEEFGKVQIVNQLRVRNNPLTTLPLYALALQVGAWVLPGEQRLPGAPPES